MSSSSSDSSNGGSPLREADLRRSIAVLALASFCSSATMRVCDPMLPALVSEFGVTLAQAASVVSLFSVAYGLAQLVHGPLGDRIGKYRMIGYGSIGAGLASLLCAVAGSLDTLVWARFVTGLTASAVIPLSFAWLGDSIAFERRQAVLARFLTGSMVGFISGQILGGILTDSIGWRWAFVALGVTFFATGVLLIRQRRLMGDAGDVRSNASMTPATMLSQYRDVFAITWARRLLMILFIEGLFFYGCLAFVPSWLHLHLDVPLWLAGMGVAAMGVGGLTYAWLGPRLIRRIGVRGLSTSGGAMLGVALAVIAWAPHLVVAIAGCYLLGLGYYFLHSTLQAHGTQILPERRGTAMSTFALTLFFSQSIGVWLFSASLASVGFPVIFIVAGIGLAVIGRVFSLALAQHHRSQPV